ncbi:YdaS family helix-turn-helix protein [Asaia astilbis]|uniref:YdaS family helix-turn-helix protein n=1 Tax=Asaia astilbis TaxID=610244 RepID=UPI0009FCC054|nr:YdaS family helix-turn-helix protein [Asaia astilbis]
MDIRDILKLAGGPSRVAKAIGRKHNTVSSWRSVPAHHVFAVSELCGLTPEQIRPDIFTRWHCPSGTEVLPLPQG